MSAEERSGVYLIDISYFIFRAYHALPPLTTSDDLPTGAVHGVATALERLLRTEKPAYVAAIFDTAAKTFRSELYPEYKANREEPDEELKVQFPYVRRLVEAMSIFSLEREGFEADDLIATLARRFAGAGQEVVIVSGDKDLMQCVGDHVQMLDPLKGARVGKAEVRAKFGVDPEQVADLQGLTGDPSDNFPGIKGIGPKTAAALIAHFGSLDALLEHTDEIESLKVRGAAGIRAKIEEGREIARLCRTLATVRIDVPVDVRLEDLGVRPVDAGLLAKLADELELERVAARLGKLAGDAPEAATAGDAASQGAREGTTERGRSAALERRTSELDLRAALPASVGAPSSLAGRVVDVVHGLVAGGTPVAHLCAGEAEAVVVGEEALAACFATLAAGPSSLRGHDLKSLCRLYGAAPGAEGLDLGVASYLVDPSLGDHGAADVTRRFLDEDLVTDLLEPDARRAALDQIARLATILSAELAARQQTTLYREIEHPLIAVLAGIEAAGILLDIELLARMSVDLDKRMRELVEKITKAAGGSFNILSPVQLREVLFERLKLPTKGVKTTKTGPSTDSETLQALAAKHPLPGLVLEYRALAKLKSTYVDALPRQVDHHSRIHTTMNQTVTATGRLSSSDPNLQNIPIRTEDGSLIRRAFIAQPDHLLISADYNQIELRVLAHLSGDETLIEAFQRGDDIHNRTAREIFDVPAAAVTPAMRRAAKVINFGIIYGMGPVRMSRELGIPRSQAADYIQRYFARYPMVQRFYGDMLDAARRDGFVSTLLGRRRYLPEIHSEHGGQRQLAERVATNTPIQGSAADIIKLAMVRLAAAFRAHAVTARLVLQIHDELLIECPKPELDQVVTLTREAMEGAVELAVPVAVDIGQGHSWAQAH